MKAAPTASSTQPRASVLTRLRPYAGDLDKLIGSLELGVIDADHYHQLEEQAQRIASGIRAAFRTPSSNRVRQ